MLRTYGAPVVAPSANRSGRPSPTRFADAVEETGDAAAAALDGGPCAVGVESTVVAVIDGARPRLLRPGGVTRAALEAVAGPLAPADGGDARRSPGRTTLHYAPEAPVRAARPPLRARVRLPGLRSCSTGGGRGLSLSPTGDLCEAAANLFAHLRAADRTRPSGIAVAAIPEHGLGEAINDRLRRAAGWVG